MVIKNPHAFISCSQEFFLYSLLFTFALISNLFPEQAGVVRTLRACHALLSARFTRNLSSGESMGILKETSPYKR